MSEVRSVGNVISRSNRPDVRNPVLALPSFKALQALPADQRAAVKP